MLDKRLQNCPLCPYSSNGVLSSSCWLSLVPQRSPMAHAHSFRRVIVSLSAARAIAKQGPGIVGSTSVPNHLDACRSDWSDNDRRESADAKRREEPCREPSGTHCRYDRHRRRRDRQGSQPKRADSGCLCLYVACSAICHRFTPCKMKRELSLVLLLLSLSSIGNIVSSAGGPRECRA